MRYVSGRGGHVSVAVTRVWLDLSRVAKLDGGKKEEEGTWRDAMWWGLGDYSI